MDILFLIFEELKDDSKSLFSCLMANRLWCETVVPILWRNPWSYSGIDYRNKSYLFFIISCYLFDYIKEFITNQAVELPSSSNQSLLFDYLSFCRNIDVYTINNIISIGSSLAYNQFFIQQEFYYFLMKKCPELNYFDMRSIKHQIFCFPEAKVLLESLCELKCDTSIDSSYFYGLSRYCQYIQRLIINNIDPKPNHGIVKLIEVQKNLQYFEWIDDFDRYYLTKDPYKEIFLALEKKANVLNHIIICFQHEFSIEHTLLQKILPKFHKLQTLMIDGYLFFTEEQLRTLAYHDLEILNIENNKLNVISSIIENSGGRLKKVFFRPYMTVSLEFDDDEFNENSFNFIRKVHEKCPYIEYLSILFSTSKENFTEFEKLLNICQNLKSILIDIKNIDEENTGENNLKYGEELLKILIRSAPSNLREIRFCNGFIFSLEILGEFLEKQRDRLALSILTIDRIYMGEDYAKLINKYKNDGVIKDFKYIYNLDEIISYSM
jgi:hypothetical protein